MVGKRRHELEFGVTPLPLVIMVIALLSYVILLIRRKQNVIPGRRTLAYFSIIALLLSIPLLLNFLYSILE
jgi:Ca2+/H+ antiporter